MRRDAALETYIKKTRTDVERQLDNLHAKRCKDNLPSEESLALKSLQQRTDIVIKPADKGSAVVVLSKEDYIKEANRQLNESVYYRKLSADPTSQYPTEVKQCVDSMFKVGPESRVTLQITFIFKYVVYIVTKAHVFSTTH